MKVGKEEVIGLLAAVEHWAGARDPEAEGARWEADLAVIAREVTQVPSVTAEVRRSEGSPAPVPRLEVRWDKDRVHWTALALRDRLLEGEPRIMLDDRASTETSLFILPFSLQPGEAEVVGVRLREALTSASGHPEKAPPPPSVRVEGTWDLEIRYLSGTSRHSLTLEQQGGELSGHHRTLFQENPVSGHVHGAEVTLSSLHRFEGTHLAYRFTGTVDQDRMEGTVELGSTGQEAIGPLNQREYGRGEWQARRST
jgi:L-seryl-tRNA(Ser) seleniumtransferase